MDEGQSQPVVLALLGLGIVAVLAVAGVSLRADDAARARTAADAAALAGAAGGRPAARAAAARNGGELTGWVDVGAAVGVEVRVGEVTVSAAARRVRRWVGSGGGGGQGQAP